MENKRPQLSIVLPARNAEPTLARAIESCLEQTFSDFELIVVEDHSHDATRRIAERLAANDPRVRVIQAPGEGGVIEAAAAGCGAAEGKLIARMDADDWAHPEKFAKQLALLEAHPELDVVSCQVEIRPAPGVEVGEGFRRYEAWLNQLVDSRSIVRERFIECPLANPTLVFRREALESVGGYRENEGAWPEDYDLVLRLVEAGCRAEKVPEVLFEWSDLPGRVTHTDARYSLERFLAAKAFYLARVPGLATKGVCICGAGPTGKRFARMLEEHGVTTRAFYEVSPRRIGEKIRGVPIVSQVEFLRSEDRGAFLVAAVGRPGARERIREAAGEAGFIEGSDFFCVA